MNDTLTIEDFSPAHDWEAITRIYNTCNPTGPRSVEELKDVDATDRTDTYRKRAVLKAVGRPIAYTSVAKATWYQDPGLYTFRIQAPNGYDDFALLFEHVLKTMLPSDALAVQYWQRSDEPDRLEFLQSKGFVAGQRNPESSVDLHQFEPGDMVAPNVRIATYADWATERPETWRHEAWRTEMELMADVPLPTPFNETPYKDFIKTLDSPLLQKEWLFVAFDGDRPVGVSQLLPNRVDPSHCQTGLTGVVASHRRQGIARAMKQKALAFAKSKGTRFVWTDNEEDNPMYTLNVALGFERRWEWVEHTLRF